MTGRPAARTTCAHLVVALAGVLLLPILVGGDGRAWAQPAAAVPGTAPAGEARAVQAAAPVPPPPAATVPVPSVQAGAEVHAAPAPRPAGSGSVLHKWWFWAAVGGVVLVSAGVLVLTTQGAEPPKTKLGNMEAFRGQP